MARPNPVFVCSACGGETLKWQGQCPLCGDWNTLEQRSAPRTKTTAAGAGLIAGAVAPRVLDSTLSRDVRRQSSGQQELDRVLGGGIVPGSVTLIGGDP